MKCKFCNKELEEKVYMKWASYKAKPNSFSFCSKSCKTRAQKGLLSEEDSKINLIERIQKYINSQNKYCGIEELIKNLKFSTKILKKYGILIKTINEELGFKRVKSKFEEDIFKILKDILFDSEIQREVKFTNCLSSKGFKLSFDFYIKELNLLIEADGTQHYDPKNGYFTSYGKTCDTEKDKYCIANNINLVRILYKRNVTKQYIKNCLRAYLPKQE